MIPTEIVPCKEDVLHCRMVLDALAVGIGQSSEPSDVHTHRQVEPFDVAGGSRDRSGLP